MARPILGSYNARLTTGTLAATLAANASIIALRNSATSDKRIYITRIQAQFVVVAAFTAASQQIFVGQRFNTATPSGGTAVTPMPTVSTMPATAATDVRASTTAALTVTSVVFETGDFTILTSAAPAAGAFLVPQVLDLSAAPIVLDEGEGFCVRNINVWPAAGTGVFSATISWYEKVD